MFSLRGMYILCGRCGCIAALGFLCGAELSSSMERLQAAGLDVERLNAEVQQAKSAQRSIHEELTTLADQVTRGGPIRLALPALLGVHAITLHAMAM